MFTLKLRSGNLKTFYNPAVMGILNVTPDSFYAGSRNIDSEGIKRRVEALVEEGTDIIDVGACSTRPDSQPCSETEEIDRMRKALDIIRTYPLDIPLSVDTYRAEVARIAAEEYNVDIINDVSGGKEDMYAVVNENQVSYILTCPIGRHFAKDCIQKENTVITVARYLAEKKSNLNLMGISDVIIDPGIGFGKSLEDNFAILKNLHVIKHCVDSPLLIGLSRKSLIGRTLNVSPDEAMNGTAVLNTVSLLNGADIIRVHDVCAARQAVALLNQLNQN